MAIVRELTPETWIDFVSLMEADAQCADCWCLNHRESPGCVTGLAARDKMKGYVNQRKANGLLAYEGGQCIGWLAIDPISDLIGHDCQQTGKDNEWSIHCIFIKDGFRGRGISRKLMEAAIQYAKSNGAKIISAFPIPEKNRNKFPVNEAEFSGRASSYEKLGFIVAGEPSDFYQRMELRY